MNNKGFTLVELLAVIVILVGISLISVSAISSSLERRDNKECEEQIELAKNAAKIYFSLNINADVTIGVKISTLKDGYFNETNKTDRLDENAYVKIVNNKYQYTGDDKCNNS